MKSLIDDSKFIATKIKYSINLFYYCIEVENNYAPLTRMIISLAGNFKASVTAEGVETKAQAEFLRSIDCDEIQGYYFSKPLPPEALEEFLRKNALAANLWEA